MQTSESSIENHVHLVPENDQESWDLDNLRGLSKRDGYAIVQINEEPTPCVYCGGVGNRESDFFSVTVQVLSPEDLSARGLKVEYSSTEAQVIRLKD